MNFLAKVVTTVVVVMVMMGASRVTASKCDPDCSGAAFGAIVSDPRNCTSFYFCLGDGIPADHPTACGPGEDFATGECAAEGAGVCPNACDGAGGCKLACNGTLDVIPVIGNCNQFMFCIPGGTQGPYSCDNDHPYFDGNECGIDESQCCDSVCDVSCEEVDTAVPDPKDCTMFYFCQEVGAINEDLHFKCPNNWNYDFTKNECSESAPCTVLCGDDPGNPNGSVTTTTTTSINSTLSPSPPPSTCLESMSCTEVGYFPACTDCQPGYFACEGVGQAGTLSKCTGSLVFNTIPTYPFCVMPSNCPYFG